MFTISQKRKCLGASLTSQKHMTQSGIKAFSQNWSLITLKVYLLVFSKISTAKQNPQLNVLVAELISSIAKGEFDMPAL